MQIKRSKHEKKIFKLIQSKGCSWCGSDDAIALCGKGCWNISFNQWISSNWWKRLSSHEIVGSKDEEDQWKSIKIPSFNGNVLKFPGYEGNHWEWYVFVIKRKRVQWELNNDFFLSLNLL